MKAIWGFKMKLKPLAFAATLVFALNWLSGTPASAQSGSCDAVKITAFGDSLTAGYGLNPGEGFPEQLQAKLNADGLPVEIINAGVSGDTTTGGLARLDWSLSQKTDAVILELGANDALRGISPALTRKNLDAMIVALKGKGLEVVLAGMLAPPNMGPAYGEEFNRIYSELSEKHGIILYPFFLDGVAADASLNQAGGIHPTKEGIAVIVDKFAPTAKKLISKLCN